MPADHTATADIHPLRSLLRVRGPNRKPHAPAPPRPAAGDAATALGTGTDSDAGIDTATNADTNTDIGPHAAANGIHIGADAQAAARRLPEGAYRLGDNLTREQGRVFLTGTQALVRMVLAQRRADLRRGLNTAGFVTGYRGSPLAGVDLAMWRASDLLQQNRIDFVPAVNEDLGATIVMGTQQAGVRADRKVDGVFSMWYGKGPGVDRAGDALHHGNAAGASRHGGVLLVVGDDHTAASSSIPHASESSLLAWGIPIVHPATVEEYEYFGLWGWALSRYCGAWVAFKVVTETVESGRAFALQAVPDFAMDAAAAGGALEYSAREFLSSAMEERMARRLDALRAFVRRHPLDRMVDPAPQATLGIVSTGKAFLDACDALQALRDEYPGVCLPTLRHYKIGLAWPIDADGLQAFAGGLRHILVVEEKAPVIEHQIKELLYNLPLRPTVCGRQDLAGAPLLPATGQLRPGLVLDALRAWLRQAANIELPAAQQGAAPMPAAAGATTGDRPLASATAATAAATPAAQAPASFAATAVSRHSRPAPAHEEPAAEHASAAPALTRRPYFCSGCPHNTSTRVPEGSQALAGVGCHYMAAWMDRNTGGLTQMGGEGADWVGLSRYIKMPHVFQNMGEGTYFHSGYLAIRQAIAAQANITYKILFNDAVAMTGGQPVDGRISVPAICQQMLGEGARRVVVTTDEPEKYRDIALPAGVTVHHRRELDRLQRELRETAGVTVLIHDQTCAAEKRRRRKKSPHAAPTSLACSPPRGRFLPWGRPGGNKNAYPDPARRLFINTAVCEGCGDCGAKSNCLSVVPVETPYGRKRAIDQSSCNKDYSCADGFCPSFVSVVGGTLRRRAGTNGDLPALPDVALPEPDTAARGAACNILVAGIGGTGVVTVGSVLAMAAHLEGRAASILDITGLAQKGGAVISHVRLSATAQSSGAVRIDRGQADVAILCDAVAAGRADARAMLAHGHTRATLNTYVAPTAEFLRNPDTDLSPGRLAESLRAAVGPGRLREVDAHALAQGLFGDAILANMLMLGYAWQRGGIPLSLAAIEQALRLNGVAVEANLRALRAGRLAAHDPSRLETLLRPGVPAAAHPAQETLEEIVERCRADLAAYQNAAYARCYAELVARVRAAELALRPGARPLLAMAVARSLHKLMAYKDEYEVARLYTNGQFRRELEQQFEGDYTLRFHMAPPLLARRDPSTGVPRKITLGPGTMKLLALLARGKALRGTWLDVFGHSAERRQERALAREYRRDIQDILSVLDERSFADALELARLPQAVRGYGHVKAESIRQYQERRAQLLERLAGPETSVNKFLHQHA